MKKLLTLLSLILISSFLIAEVKNPGKPAKGEWDFNLEQVWEAQNAGSDVIAGPGPMAVSEDGTIYVRDWKNKKHFMFSKDGKFLRAFAKKGEAPGEVRRIDEAEMFFAGDTFIIADIGKVHYFSKKGDFIKSQKNTSRKRMPHLFLNEDEFIYAPVFKSHMPDGTGEISRFNLKTQEESALVKFTIGKPRKNDQRPAMIVGGLTPMMIIGYGNKKLYYGMNDTYRITVSDLSGKIVHTFSVRDKKEKISKEKKRKFFSQWGDPPAFVEKCVDTTPGELAHFIRIEEINGLIYVFGAFFGQNQEKQRIDIFSPQGKYLYRSFIKPGNGSTIYYSHIKNLVIKKDYLYMLIEDEEGDIKIAKYKISLPK